jgi:hypothetical protein
VKTTIPGGVELIALHHTPDEIAALLPPSAAGQVHIVAGDPVDIGLGPVNGSDRIGGAPSDGVVTFPIDGPIGAVELAVAGLFRGRRATIAAPSTPGGAPTAWWVLDLLSRYTTPAVDLRGVGWLDEAGIWWTHPTGPVRLPLMIDGPAASMTAARVLRVAEAVRPGEPVSAWLDAASAETHPSSREWGALLCSRYVSMALEHLARRLGERSVAMPVD